MNDNLLIFLTIALLIPLFVSPISVKGFGVDDGNINVLIEFETPKNEEAIKNNIEQQLFGKFNAIANDFKNKANYTSFQSLNFTVDEHVDGMLFSLGGSGNEKRYQITPELQYIGVSNITLTDFNIEFDLQVSQLRLDLLEFIENNNGESVRSHLKFSFGEVEINELF